MNMLLSKTQHTITLKTNNEYFVLSYSGREPTEYKKCLFILIC